MKLLIDHVPYDKNNKYHRVYHSITADKRISPLAYKLFIILSNWNPRSKTQPRIDKLAEFIGVNEKELKTAIINLKICGYLKSSGIGDKTVWNIHPIPLENIDYVTPKYYKK